MELKISGNRPAPLAKRTDPEITIVLSTYQVSSQTEQAVVLIGFYYRDSGAAGTTGLIGAAGDPRFR